MKIKGNVSYKDNVKLVYANLVLFIFLAYMIYTYYQERNFKDIAIIDSSHEVYRARMVRVPEQEALIAQLKAHLKLSFHYLYNLSEYNYQDYVERALHLWSYEGFKIIGDYEKEGLYDLLTSTPTRTECLIKEIEYLGQREIESLQYPNLLKDNQTSEISFANQVKNNVRTYKLRIVTYHRIIRGSEVLSEEIHTEEIEVYTGFDIDSDYNPFGFKTQTITRDVQRITNK